MGMFDSFYLRAKCPYCGNKETFEFQTKRLANAMFSWQEGEKMLMAGLSVKDGEVQDCLAGCNSKKCRTWEKKKIGYTSGFGRQFYGDVIIKNGKIYGVRVRKMRLHK